MKRTDAMMKMTAGFVIASVMLLTTAFAHDKRYAITSEQKNWFDSLKSGKGPCCSDADGTVLSDVDWKSNDGHYTVFIKGQWIDVPDDAVLKQPNMYGPTMVWPLNTYALDGQAKVQIRCFIAGVMG